MRTKSRLIMVGVLVLGALVWHRHGDTIGQTVAGLIAGGDSPDAPHAAVQAYKAAQRRGNKSEICRAAGEVVLTYRQAGNEDQAYRWTSIEAADCREAR